MDKIIPTRGRVYGSLKRNRKLKHGRCRSPSTTRPARRHASCGRSLTFNNHIQIPCGSIGTFSKSERRLHILDIQILSYTCFSKRRQPEQYLRNRASRLSKELLITPLTPPSPTLPPDQHRPSHKHGQEHPNAEECKRPAVIRYVDEMLHREGNGEVDAGGTNCENDDEFSGNLSLSGDACLT
jgi:hypothetical protein